jgi:hypothetical protein
LLPPDHMLAKHNLDHFILRRIPGSFDREFT